MFREGPPPGNKPDKPVQNPFSRTEEFSGEQEYGSLEKQMRAEFDSTFGDMLRTMGKQEKEDAFLKWRRQKAAENLKKATQSS